MKQETEIGMLTLHCQIILLNNDNHPETHDIQNKKASYKLSLTPIKTALSKIHDTYVLVPADKAANNVIIV